jgi:hypothetical protein
MPDTDYGHIPTFAHELSDFMHTMALQSDRNWHKGGRDTWLETSFEIFLTSLQISIAELRTALTYGVDVDEKAADVANYAFYIWDQWCNNNGTHIGGVNPE